MKDQQETSIVVRNPSREASTTRPRNVSLGAEATECTRKSIRP
jgi:hypothetical protein